MKFTLTRDVFFDALHKVQNVVEKKSTVQILSNVLLSVQSQSLVVTATDLEVGINVTIPLEEYSAAQSGKIALSAKSLVDIVRELPNKPITLEVKENNRVQISCHKSTFNLVGLGADEYPPFSSFDSKPYVDANIAVIKEMIDKSLFAASTDETRYHLNGVFLESIENGMVRMVATDGHRLSFIDRELFLRDSSEILPKEGIIVPRKGLVELKRLLDNCKSKVETFQFAVDKNSLLVRLENTALFIRLIDGEYPDYEQVVPKKSPNKVTAARDDLLASLKRASLFANEKSKGVKLAISDKLLTLTSSNPDLGEAKEELDVIYSGEEADIGFNARYLIECLGSIDCDEVSLEFNDRLSAGVIRPLGREDYTYVVMPMRI
jgi:DNA polymerase-3 subunit beta